MNELTGALATPSEGFSFTGINHTPGEHFKLYFYAAVLQLLPAVIQAFDSPEAAFESFPFLAGYNNEIARYGLDGIGIQQAVVQWQAAVIGWETQTAGFLPILALRQATGLDYMALVLFFVIGLADEDMRFGALFETLQGLPGQHHMSQGLLNAFWQWTDAADQVRPVLNELQNAGLVQIHNPESPRLEWILQVPPLVWDGLHGDINLASLTWAHFRPVQELVPLDQLILPPSLEAQLAPIPGLLLAGEVQALIVRGPHHNGRRTLLGAVARQLGYNVLEVPVPRLAAERAAPSSEEPWRQVGPLATLHKALPVFVYDPAPGETVELHPLHGYRGPIGVVMGHSSGLRLPVGQAVTLTLDLPGPSERRQHWQASLDSSVSIENLDDLANRFRMTGGYIRRAARIARSYAALDGRSWVESKDVRQAERTLNGQVLDTLAQRLVVSGDWSHLAVGTNTMKELVSLEARCRHRERLSAAVHPSLSQRLNPGVRALFSGPSGTGKTLAASLLASVLQMDIFRLDLSAVVNKYIGETEKNLSQVFDRAEELDVILLLDEGDALLTQRTNVQNANDRYANLETNYLLQRIESFEGILIVTTNAGERIDSAFQRRMDVVIDFYSPDAAERWDIWNLHLPPGHSIEGSFLRDVAARCTLTGGQIRNATLHASLLALNNGGVITTSYLEEAVQREYRKIGAVFPLRKRD